MCIFLAGLAFLGFRGGVLAFELAERRVDFCYMGRGHELELEQMYNEERLWWREVHIGLA